MKTRCKLLIGLLAVAAVMVTGCGGNSDKANSSATKTTTYTTHYSMETVGEISNPGLFPVAFDESLIGMTSSQNQLFLDYELSVTGDEYTLTAKAYSGAPDTGKAYVVGDDSGIAITILNVSTGKISESSQTAITIEAPTSVTYSIPKDVCDSIGEQMASLFTMAEPDAESACGEWNSEEYPELLESVPALTFTVTSDGEITGWK